MQNNVVTYLPVLFANAGAWIELADGLIDLLVKVAAFITAVLSGLEILKRLRKKSKG